MDCGHALGSDTKEAFGASAPFRSWVASAGLHITFCFQPVGGGLDGTDRNLSLGAGLNLASNRDAVGLVTQTQNNKKHDVLEFPR
jgi:hypothetical protein